MKTAEPLNLGSRREVFWDDCLIDTQQTTAQLQLYRPQAREVILDHCLPKSSVEALLSSWRQRGWTCPS